MTRIVELIQLSEEEKLALKEIMSRSRGAATATASSIGISRNTLYNAVNSVRLELETLNAIRKFLIKEKTAS